METLGSLVIVHVGPRSMYSFVGPPVEGRLFCQGATFRTKNEM